MGEPDALLSGADTFRVEHLTKETLRRFRIAFRREQEIDRLSRRVHCSVEIPVFCLYLDVCLVDGVTLVGRLQIRPAAPVQFRCVCLHPAPDAAGIHQQAALAQEFRNVLVRKRVRRYHRTAETITSPG